MSKQPGGYPRQQPAYPQQQQQHPQYQGMQPYQPYPQYPPQQAYGQGQPMPPASYGVVPSTYGVPPPPYTAAPQQPPPRYPTQQMYSVQQPAVMPMTHGRFDAGARFHQGVQPHIPPPPPGCPPTGAQHAASQGQPTVMTQNPSSWMSGGSDGGYTVW